MRVYIFGAGASKGAQPNNVGDQRTAPLMDELFRPSYREYTALTGLTDADLTVLRADIGDQPVENWLTAEWQRVENYGPQRQQAGRVRLARLAFYIWHMFLAISTTPARETQYDRLLRQLLARDEPFGLISFNYDTMLDQVVQDMLGWDLTTLESYHRAKLVKPHGSVNWLFFRRGTDPRIETDREGNVVDYAARYQLASGRMFGQPLSDNGGDIYVIPPSHRAMRRADSVYRWVDNFHFYPLLMLPLLTKAEGTLSTWVPAMPIKWAQELLREADDIYVVGYRARDETFRDMVSAAKDGARLHVVGRSRDSAQEVTDRVLGLSSTLTSGIIYDAGFAAYVDAGSP